ncbi:hypothetical protein GYMLUDRAFT_262771 [Collybiopsis luxurians FD-317 M1]|uniref:Alpha/beta hydrolase fold-3 domain-containing protein n=1 Tax=Collybiopsis luxurians FD-317 M1 TaxID=944289 RepID=A0A0D0CQY3_9AGAR|nr:hypothetical protein GYMLUDRAFT_262771 [Collybiopsis luxurians FD-317 M1]
MVLRAQYAQPFKAIYLFYSFCKLVAFNIPYWLLINAVPSNRPRSSWSLKKSLIVKAFHWMMGLMLRTGELQMMPDHNKVEPNSNGLWVNAAPEHLFDDGLRMWLSVAQVKPCNIPGYYYTRNSASSHANARKTVYHLHGGAYVIWSASPACTDAARIPKGYLTCTNTVASVFALEYRLSSFDGNGSFENPFPAALLDAFAGYLHLIEQGYSPHDIVISGDSAGAHLALALCRYLQQAARKGLAVPALPSKLILLSPWPDFGVSHQESYKSVKGTDYLRDHDFPQSAITAFLGPHPRSMLESPYISPASIAFFDEDHIGLFRDFPNTFIAVGTGERLLSSQRDLAKLMRRDMGDNKVVMYEAEDCVHDYCAFDWEEPKRSQTFAEIDSWLTGK